MAQPPGLPEQMIAASADAFFGYFLDAWAREANEGNCGVKCRYHRCIPTRLGISAMNAMRLSVRHDGGWAVVTVSGEIDMSSAPEWDHRMRRLQLDGPPTSLVIDLAGVTFMDAQGLSVLVRAVNRAREHDLPPPLLAAPSARVVRLLEITGLNRVLATCEDVASALATTGSQ
jgi:anti-anti-sigma factor